MNREKIKKKRIRTVLKTYVILAMFCAQLVLISYGSISTASSNTSAGDAQASDTSSALSNSSGSGYSTPYYIPIKESTPLNSQDPNDSSPGVTPQSASSYEYTSDDDFYTLSINLDKYVVKEWRTINVQISLNDNLTACQEYPIHIEIFKGFYRNGYSYLSNYYDAQCVFSNLYQTNSSGEFSFSYNANSGYGLYTIYAFSNNASNVIYAYNGFTVGEMGLFFRGSEYYMTDQEYTASIQLVNTTNFSPLGSIPYSYKLEAYTISPGNSQGSWGSILTGEGLTNNYGYSIFTTNQIPELSSNSYGSIRLVINASFGLYSVEFTTFIYLSWDYYYYTWSGQHQANTDKIQYVITTDKTLYSPGETIHLRALVLDYSYLNETKLPLQNQSIQLIVYNPDNLAIFWVTLNTDEYGVMEFQFPLDQDSNLGQYGFEFNYQNNTYRYNINVENYVKPVFQVTIDTNGQDYYPESNTIKAFFTSIVFKGDVYVEYYFGQPVVGANVKLYLRDWSGNIRYTYNGTTNAEGKAYFSINLKSIDNLDYSFTATANVTDIYGRTASYEKAYSRINEIYISPYLDNWAPKPNDTVKCFFSVYQLLSSNGNSFFGYTGYSYNPLQNVTAKIAVYGIRDYPIIISTIRDKAQVASYQVETDQFGSGELDFQLPALDIAYYQFFQIQISITLNDGRSVTGFVYFRYQKYSLDISLSNDHLKPGDTLNLNVVYKDNLLNIALPGEAQIYIYDSKYNLIGSAYVSVWKSTTLHFKIPEYASEGQYYIYSYVYSRANQFFGGFRYSSTSKSFFVGNAYDISLTTNKTASNNNPNELTMKLGETLSVTGKTNVTSNMPYYLEIYKRGLVASQKLDVSGNTFGFSIEISELLSPEFTILVYTIASTGKVVQDYLVVDVTSDYGFNITTDKQIYKPGDSVTLTITPNSNTTQLLSISFIDSSLLAIAPENDSELDYFTTSSYYAYIESGSSWGFGIDSYSYWWAGYEYNTKGYYNLYYYSPNSLAVYYANDKTTSAMETGNNQGNLAPPSFTDILNEFNTQIRENITESANWIPEMVISKPTNITFSLPDNIGAWTIRVVGNNIGNPSAGNENNNVLWGNVLTTQIRTFLPFFVEFDIPEPVIQDDILSIKAYVYNYLGTNVNAFVAINAPDLIVLNDKTQEINVPNGFVSEVEFSVYCNEAFSHNITIIAATNTTGIEHSDAKELSAYIQPNGITLQNRSVNFINASDSPYTINYTLDSSAIYHKEVLAFYSDMMDISIENWQLLIGYPYGCVEQTISKLLPTVLVYNYLNSTGQLTQSLQQQLSLMILQGLNRIYSFQHTDGGWGWWQDDQSKLIMTTKVLSVLGKISNDGFKISPIAITKAINYITDQQSPNGTWKFETDYNNLGIFEDSAYVLNSLLPFENLSIQANTSIPLAITSMQSLWQNPNYHTPLGAALFYLTTKNTTYENTTFNNELISYLLSSKINNGDTTYWSSGNNNYYYNLGGDIETTSYATWALALDDYIGYLSIIQNSIRYILNGQGMWGWSNTADTSAAIESLTAIKSLGSQNGLIDFNGTVNVNIDGANSSQFEVNLTQNPGLSNNFALTLDKYIVPGENSINITLNGTGGICCTLESQQILRANPQIDVNNGNDVINLKPGELYNLTVNLYNIDPQLPLTNTEIKVYGIPDNLMVSGIDYDRNFDVINNNSSVNFLIQAPDKAGSYSISGVSVKGTIVYQNLNGSNSLNQLYRATIGKIVVNVVSQNSQQSGNYNTINFNTINSNAINSNTINSNTINSNAINSNTINTKTSILPLSSSSSSGNITITKQMSKLTGFIPGDIINCTIKIENNGDPLEFYALDDAIPSGTQLVPGSFSYMTGTTFSSSSAITMSLTSDGIHFFLPLIPTGITVINYQIQVVSIRNSNAGQCTLWGMYDNFSISTTAQVLENIPIKYNLNNSMYQDFIHPSITGLNISQIQNSNQIEVKVELNTFDENSIHKVRISYAQGSNWQAQTIYTSNDSEKIQSILSDFNNVNSKVSILVDVFDAYGNVISSQIQVINVHSKLIPYISIGIAFGLCLGLAGIVSSFYKKRMLKRKNKETDESRLIDANRLNNETKKQISFLDENES